jgi:D-arabinose 1-dehydrogenase-like Zn-dependent alcohol dehydrogenase
MIAAARGARVIAVDVAPAALARAAELGAQHVVPAGPGTDPADVIQQITGGGAHVSIDALGSPATAASSLRCLRPHGRHVQVGLLIGPDASPPLPMNLIIARELEIYGSHGMAARDYPAMLSQMADRTLTPELLLGTVIGLADAGQALADMDRPASVAGMTVIDMEERAR